MAKAEENLDDVIANLIDDDVDEEQGSQEPEKGGPQQIEQRKYESPVILTKRAAEQVRNIRERENLDDELYLRVAVEGGGCSGLSYKLGFDWRNDEDELIKSRGVEIVLDKRHKLYLDGVQIDYPDGLDARGFTFDNPNASETCGCGSSFAT